MLDRVLVKNISSLFSLRITSYIIPLITLPYLVRVLEPEGYGTFAYCIAIIQYFVIAVNYGFDLSATKKIAENNCNKEEISKIFWNVISVRLLIAFIGLLLLFGLSVIFNEISKIFILLLLLYMTVLEAVFFPQWLFQGKEQLGMVSIAKMSLQIINIPLIFLFISDEEDIWKLASLIALPGVLIIVFSSFLIVKRGWICWVKPSFSEMKSQILDGWHLFISTAAISLYTTSTVVILGIITGPTSVAIYVSANKLLQAALGIYTPITASFYPRINNLMVESKEKALKLIQYVIKLQVFITLVLSILMFFLAPYVVSLLFGAGYEQSVEVLQIMSVLPIIIGLSHVFGVLVLLSHGYKKEFSSVLLLSGFFSLFTLIPLCYYFGAIGAAVSVVITECIVTLLMLILIKKNKIPVFKKIIRTNNEI